MIKPVEMQDWYLMKMADTHENSYYRKLISDVPHHLQDLHQRPEAIRVVFIQIGSLYLAQKQSQKKEF